MNKKNILTITFLVIAIALILSGGFTDCMHKGIAICWECIGLG